VPTGTVLFWLDGNGVFSSGVLASGQAAVTVPWLTLAAIPLVQFTWGTEFPGIDLKCPHRTGQSRIGEHLSHGFHGRNRHWTWGYAHRDCVGNAACIRQPPSWIDLYDGATILLQGVAGPNPAFLNVLHSRREPILYRQV